MPSGTFVGSTSPQTASQAQASEFLQPGLRSLRDHVDVRVSALEVAHANRLDRLERLLESLSDEQRLLNRRLDTLERGLLLSRVLRLEDVLGLGRTV